ncbi:O-antigen polymerase [Bifidobacterium pullorum]|uniref:O-antigen polymerase n=1 Tax=Bifidobacterium pullorum TaxID=78448 RepID=UPI003F24E729
MHRNICTPVVFFAGIWFIVLSAGSLRLFGFSGYSDKTAILITVGVFFFAAGVYVIESLMDWSDKRKNISGTLSGCDIKLHRNCFRISEWPEISLNMSFLYIILALSCIGYLYFAYYSIRAMSTGLSIGEVRENLLGYTENSVIINPIFDAFYTYFCSPAMAVLLPVAIIFLFQNKHKKFVIISALCFLLGIVSRGGRMEIFDALLISIVCFKFYQCTLSRRTKRILLIFIVCGVIGMSIITIARGNAQIFRNVYTYFTISTPMFEQYSQAFVQADYISYGGATFYPFFYLLNIVFNIFGEHSAYLDRLVYFVGYPQNTWISGLFPEGDLNAFCSEFYFFYMDFRVFGIILFSFMHGAICSFFYVRSFKQHNPTMLIWYLLLVHSMFFSFVIWRLGNTKFFVSITILLVAQFTVGSKREIYRNIFL